MAIQIGLYSENARVFGAHQIATQEKLTKNASSSLHSLIHNSLPPISKDHSIEKALMEIDHLEVLEIAKRQSLLFTIIHHQNGIPRADQKELLGLFNEAELKRIELSRCTLKGGNPFVIFAALMAGLSVGLAIGNLKGRVGHLENNLKNIADAVKNLSGAICILATEVGQLKQEVLKFKILHIQQNCQLINAWASKIQYSLYCQDIGFIKCMRDIQIDTLAISTDVDNPMSPGCMYVYLMHARAGIQDLADEPNGVPLKIQPHFINLRETFYRAAEALLHINGIALDFLADHKEVIFTVINEAQFNEIFAQYESNRSYINQEIEAVQKVPHYSTPKNLII